MFLIKVGILLTPAILCGILMAKEKSEEALILMAVAYGSYAGMVLFP